MEKWIAVLSTIVIAVIYLTGYSYLDGFNEFFNVSLQELEFSPQDILVHAALPFRSSLSGVSFPIVLLVIFMSFIALCAMFGMDVVWSRTKLYVFTIPKIYFTFLFLGLALWVSLSVFFGAHQLGLRNAELHYLNLNRMVVLGAPSEFDITGFKERNPNTNLFHIISTSKTYFGAVKFNGEERRWIIRIPKTQHTAIRVYQDVVD